MSRALLVRSIPLSRDTREAWKVAGAMFARRDRSPVEVLAIQGDRPIINLGNSAFDLPNIWNRASTVSPLLSPQKSRIVFDSIMPTNRWSGSGFYWLKGPGRAGANKEMIYVDDESHFNEITRRADWIQGDVQRHIDGQEYRVITVNDKVVQVTERYGENGSRDYRWVGVSAAPDRVKRVARSAARLLGNEQTIVGWDVIAHDYGGSYILEGNSCPGVNVATANRILDAVEGISYND